MNIPRYNFAKESEPELLKFLKAAKEHKSSNCDIEKHRIWQKLLPPDPALMRKLDEAELEQITVIDLSSDEEPIIPQAINENLKQSVTEALENEEKSSISDVAFAIKENLETQCELSEIARESLAKCLINELEELFQLLNETLTSEEIFHFGVSLQNHFLSTVFNCYCRYLLLPRVKKEYNDNLLTLIDQCSIKHSSVLKEELLSNFHRISDKETNILLQYINNLNPDYQAVLLRDFIFSIDKLDNNNLLIVESLMNGQVEYEALNKLVEMLSNIAEEHSKDKAFGKLLVNAIQFLGPNVILLEQPLKHIIAGHKSVWRSKLEKTFSTCYEDTSMFSQSFRD